MRFTKKPVTIDAIQFTGDNLFDCLRFMRVSESVIANPELKATDAPIIHTPEGTMSTSPGDWIIRGVKGEYYPCKPDIFAMTYDEGEVPLLQLKGDISKEEFDEFKRKWESEIQSGSRTAILDSEDALHKKIADLNELLDSAWGIIANAGGGDWGNEKPEWKDAAVRWRESYHQILDMGGLAKDAAVMMAEAWNQKAKRDMNAYEPPPVKRDDLVPAWETVIEEFRDRYKRDDISAAELRVVSDVLDDMTARDATGRAKYGVPLTAYNGRDQLVDAYQESLDFAVYLRAAMDEGLPVSAVYSNALHNIFWLRVTINGRDVRAA